MPDKMTKYSKASARGGLSSENEIDKINRYTRREMKPDEVYTFSVILCDNEIDRDKERFSIEALHKLAELYLGKTGVFDHRPTASGQTARIFDTKVLTDRVTTTSTGEPYTWVEAKAYMVVGEATKDTILSIDAGILKEVSVGLAVGEMLCSECGANVRIDRCEHKKGDIGAGGTAIHLILNAPTDAFEWSFVAVPAQVNAGVIKHYRISHTEENLEESEKQARIAEIMARRASLMEKII